MGVLQMVKDAVTGGDDVADLVARLDAERAKGAATCAEIERLEQTRLQAEDYDAAKASMSASRK
jgi:hypothetical protein